MVTRSLVLSSSAGTIVVETSGSMLPGVMALAGLEGLGWPDVDVQWASGAGDGATLRGAMHLPRDLVVPVKITGADRADLWARLSLLARVLDPAVAPARLSWVADGESWWIDVVRVGGGQITAGDRSSTDLETHVRTSLSLRSGDPFWTREEAMQQTIRSSSARGLLGTGRSLSMLRVSSSQAMGVVQVDNPGDAPAWPMTSLTGPAETMSLVSSSGETLAWSGTLLAGESRMLDHRAKTIVDPAAVADPDHGNRYDELGPAPRFWAVRPGSNLTTVTVTGATSGTRVVLSWRPRRQMVI